MTTRAIHLSVWFAVAALAALFLLLWSGLDFSYVIPKRLARLQTIIIGGICVALSSIIFQTIAGNRILTPTVMGYEAVFLFFQSLLILLFGTQSLTMFGEDGNFALSILLMLAYSWAIHHWLFKGGRNNIYVLLLLGLVLTTIIATFTQFVQLRINPGEFAVLQGFSEASFTNTATWHLIYSALLVLVTFGLVLRLLPSLDVLLLGRERAISLGINHPRQVFLLLGIVAILVAISTSLIGPSGFMGIFIANITYMLAGTYQHRVLLPLGCAVAIVTFLLAQLLVEHVFNYGTTVGILINLLSGAYFLALMAYGRRSL